MNIRIKEWRSLNKDYFIFQYNLIIDYVEIYFETINLIVRMNYY